MAALYPATTQFPATTLFPQGPDGPVLLAHLGFEDPITDDGNRDWVNVTDRLRGEALRTRGRASELDTVEPTVVSCMFENRDSELSPENTGGAHFGDLVPMRRLWLRGQYENETQDLFKGYVEGFDPDWPEAGFDNVCRVTATDGSKVLNLWKLEAPQTEPSKLVYGTGGYSKMRVIQPPGSFTVSDPYAVRVLEDRPWAYYRMGEKAGGSRLFDSSGQGRSGRYVNTPTLGGNALIAGTSNSSASFERTASEDARASTGTPEGNQFTIECWFNLDSAVAGSHFPFLFAAKGLNGLGNPSVSLEMASTDMVDFGVSNAADSKVEARTTTSIVAGTTYYVVGTYDGANVKIYLNGVLEDTAAQTGVMLSGDDDLSIGSSWGATTPASTAFLDGSIDEVAIYDKALTAEQIEQHYQIGSQGFLEQASGERIGEALDQAGIFAVRSLQAGDRELLPVAYASGSALDIIQQAVYSEGIPSLFYFDRTGVPVFLERGYRANAPYTTTQVTFGQAAGEVDYQTLDIATGDGFLYNVIRTGRDEEDAVPQMAEDATSKGRYLTRVYEKTGMICTTDANAQDEADAILAIRKDPFTRIISVDVALTDLLGTISSRHAINRLLSLELGEKVVVKREDRYGATTLSQTSYVEADELRMAAGAAGWTMRLGVSPR